MSLVLDTGAMKYRENPSQPWRPLVIKAGMNWESMADTYDPDNGTYEVGQYVLEEGMMYRCIYEITIPEAWTPAHWTSANVADELASFIIISDDQPTEDSNKIWIAETTSPFGVQIPTMDDHNALGNTLNTKADEESLALRRTGSTNTRAQIETGTFFYLDGTLKHAIATIAQNASFTAQNCETVTAGGLNDVLTWKLVGQRTGKNDTIPFANLKPFAKEILVVVNIAASGNKESIQIPMAEISSGSSWWRAGGYTTVGTPALVIIYVNGTSGYIELTHASIGSEDKSDTTTFTVYYR